MDATLEREWQSFAKSVDRLLEDHRGQYVLWRDDTAVEFFDTYERALASGLRRFGLDDTFLVAEVEAPNASLRVARQARARSAVHFVSALDSTTRWISVVPS